MGMGMNPDSKETVLSRWKDKLTTKEGWIGSYDFAWLCLPSLPSYHPYPSQSSSPRSSSSPPTYSKWNILRRLQSQPQSRLRVRRRPKPPPFFALDEDIPLLLAIICGLQHALAMLAGLITPPILFAGALNLDGVIQVRLILSLYLLYLLSHPIQFCSIVLSLPEHPSSRSTAPSSRNILPTPAYPASTVQIHILPLYINR